MFSLRRFGWKGFGLAWMHKFPQSLRSFYDNKQYYLYIYIYAFSRCLSEVINERNKSNLWRCLFLNYLIKLHCYAQLHNFLSRPLSFPGWTTEMLFWLDFHQTQSNLYKWFRMQQHDWSSTSPSSSFSLRTLPLSVFLFKINRFMYFPIVRRFG